MIGLSMKRRLSAFLLVLGTALTAFVASAAHAQPAAVERGLPDFADLVERTGPAVVNIRTTERARANAPSAAPNAPGAPQMPEGMDGKEWKACELCDDVNAFFARRFGEKVRINPVKLGRDLRTDFVGHGLQKHKGITNNRYILFPAMLTEYLREKKWWADL